MRVSTKGQVTIPKPLRDRIGIGAGGEVEFGLDGETITLRKAEKPAGPGPTRGERLVAALKGTATANRDLTTDEIMKLLRGDD